MKYSTEPCEVSITLFCVLPALNFKFRNLIPFGFKFRSCKAGRLKENVQNLVVPRGRVCYFTLFLPQLKPKLKGYVYVNIVTGFKSRILSRFCSIVFVLQVKLSNQTLKYFFHKFWNLCDIFKTSSPTVYA